MTSSETLIMLRKYARDSIEHIHSEVQKIERLRGGSINDSELAEHLISAESFYKTIVNYDIQILETMNTDQKKVEMQGIAKFSDIAHKCIAILKRLSKSTDQASTQPLPPYMPLVAPQAQLCLDTVPEPFDGNRLQYKAFIAQFENWISRRTAASDTDRLIALRKMMRGEAKTLIDSLSITDTNYSVALKLLGDNFGQVDIIRYQVISSLLSPPKIKSAHDLASLRNFLNKVQSSMKTLESLSCPLSSYSVTLQATLRGVVPAKLLFDFAEQKRLLAALQPATQDPQGSADQDEASKAAKEITQLIDFISRYTASREEAAAATSAVIPSEHRPREKENPNSGHRRRPVTPQRRSTVAGAVRGLNPRPGFKPCLFCKTPEHSSSRCAAPLSRQQRVDIINQQKRCERCFRPKHNQAHECRGPAHECLKCKSKEHYTSMHFDNAGQLVSAATSTPDSGTNSLLLTASAFLTYRGTRTPIRIFLDTGSTLTFVNPQTLTLMPGASPLHQADLSIQGFASAHDISSGRYKITIESTYGNTRIDLFAYAYDFAVNPENRCPQHLRKAIEAFGKSHSIADRSLLGELPTAPPALLVGIDQFYKIAFIGQETKITENIIAKDTRLGWILGGPTAPALIRANVACIQAHCCSATLSKPARDIQALWKIEALGVVDSPKNQLSADDDAALRQFNGGIEYNGKEYTVSVPKKESISELSNNKLTAVNRLESKIRSLQNDPAKYARYDAEITSFHVENNAEEVLDFDPLSGDSRDGSYYMPHHQVVTQSDQKEKWRIVFDCSASKKGEDSLNDHLLTGPNLNPELVDLLLNFRIHDVALSADITKAYMCIAMKPEDRPYFRFLWRGPADQTTRCFQMKKVTWGAAPSGFLLAATLRELLKRADPHSNLNVGEFLYHDDLIRSFPTKEETIRFIELITSWLGSANMKLAKWKTNSSAVAHYIHASGPGVIGSNEQTPGILKVLGIQWSPSDDKIHFLIDPPTVSFPLTKRSILRVVASIFDPMGWLAPFVLRGRLMIQNLWKSDLKWDDSVDDDLASTFRKWVDETHSLGDFKVPRTYGTPNKAVTGRDIHIFGDASESAYACAAYLQSFYEDGTSETALIMAKSRLAPLDTISLPRLELMAALIVARIKKFLCDKLKITPDRTFLYTDSMITFHWATAENPNRWKTFVANRVSEIQELTSPSDWYFVPGDENPADFATRGVSAHQLITNSAWWAGPKWLALPPAGRKASQPHSNKNTSDVSKEIRAVSAPAVQNESLIKLDQHSSISRAVRVLANVIQFINLCRRRPPLSHTELCRLAENHILRETQDRFFPREIRATKDDDQLPRNSKLSAFRVFLDDDGILRANTRLTEGPQFSYDEKNPIIIPGESRLAVLLVQHQHRINAHFGVNTVLSSIRKRFWITRGRQVIKSILGRCVICRKRHGAHGTQVSAPLPEERVTLLTPFATTGLDYCGPFYTRSGDTAVKNYIALFTCASTRAIHLELVPTMSTPMTHLAMRRFLSAYPGCRTFISDNGRSFVKAASDIKRLLNQNHDADVKQLLQDHRLEWKFNCPQAPWRGGFFERLVGSVKSALIKTLGKSLVSFEELRTVITELATVINERPLTYEVGDPEGPRALTPAHLIRAGPPSAALCSLTPLDRLGQCVTTPTTEDLGNASRLKTSYFQALSVRWYREYMLQLRSANHNDSGKPRPIKIGDVCLLREDNTPRIKWRPVLITESHTGRDGVVRTHSVRFPNGNSSRRAVQLLYPLEVVD